MSIIEALRLPEYAASAPKMAALWDAAASLSDECIPYVTEAGYRPDVRIDGKGMQASRAVWMIATMSDPGEANVLHSCGNGRQGCINIRHLRLGTRRENMRDIFRHDASRKTAVTVEKVLAIRRDFVRTSARRSNVAVLAMEHELDVDVVRRITRGDTFGYLTASCACS